MIIVIANVVIISGNMQQALALSQAHVARSRLEDGCVSHCVQCDIENPQRLIFIEEWASKEALLKHFQIVESQQFAQALSELAASPPEMKTYQANKISLADLSS